MSLGKIFARVGFAATVGAVLISLFGLWSGVRAPVATPLSAASSSSSSGSSSSPESPAMSRTLGQTITLPATGRHTATMIMLHGLGDSGRGWASGAQYFQPPYVKVVLPTAPIRPVTVNNGFPMTAWFDIHDLGPSLGPKETFKRKMKIVEPEVMESVSHVRSMIEAEKKSGIPADRIILGGFSQGALIALKTLITEKERLGGVVALSFGVYADEETPKPPKEVLETPVFLSHGDNDPIVPLAVNEVGIESLQHLGFENVQSSVFSGQHEAPVQILSAVRSFITTNVPEKN